MNIITEFKMEVANMLYFYLISYICIFRVFYSFLLVDILMFTDCCAILVRRSQFNKTRSY